MAMDGFGYDPVTAIAEADATGAVADIFADIRATMEIPMLTSIWRGLVAVDGGLESGWAAVKPLYLSGQPAAALARVVDRAILPIPAPLQHAHIDDAGLSADDLAAARAIVDAYSRSNGMNLVALTALVTEPSGEPAAFPAAPSPNPWPELRPLKARPEIDDDTWSLVERVNRFGTGTEPGEVATLWRHLAHWPGLLTLIETGFAALDRDGGIDQAIRSVHDEARKDAARIARLRQDPVELPTAAREMITHYVATPYRVTRMVALGHGLSRWLAAAQ